MKKIKTALFLDKEQHDKLKKLSMTAGAPISWHVRQAISEYLKRVKK
jgi:predicted DNA-binding protein